MRRCCGRRGSGVEVTAEGGTGVQWFSSGALQGRERVAGGKRSAAPGQRRADDCALKGRERVASPSRENVQPLPRDCPAPPGLNSLVVRFPGVSASPPPPANLSGPFGAKRSQAENHQSPRVEVPSREPSVCLCGNCIAARFKTVAARFETIAARFITIAARFKTTERSWQECLCHI